jgi:hypothetical protein
MDAKFPESSFRKDFDTSTHTVLLSNDFFQEMKDFGSVSDIIEQFIGFANCDFVERGQRFENPYDRYSHFQVIDFDDNHILVRLQKNEQ